MTKQPKKKFTLYRPRGRTFDSYKPEKFKHYLTIGELVLHVKHDVRWIKRLEAAGKIPRAVRHNGVRLYSPDQVKDVENYFATSQTGRPKRKVN